MPKRKIISLVRDWITLVKWVKVLIRPMMVLKKEKLIRSIMKAERPKIRQELSKVVIQKKRMALRAMEMQINQQLDHLKYRANLTKHNNSHMAWV